MNFSAKKYTYFASDFHLGSPNYESSLEREKKIVAWLNEIENSASAIYLVGDIFYFWFECKKSNHQKKREIEKNSLKLSKLINKTKENIFHLYLIFVD
jgi:UDP-2,3-diacylglucosamine pyrophosphatase LpxH